MLLVSAVSVCFDFDMSAKGLGRVKTPFPWEVGEKLGTAPVSGRDRSHQRLGPNDVHDSCQIVGQDR